MSLDTILDSLCADKPTYDCPSIDQNTDEPMQETDDTAPAKKHKKEFLNNLARASTLALRQMHQVAVEHAKATTVVDSFGFVVTSEVMTSVRERLRKNLEAQGIIATIKQASTLPTPVKKIRKKRATNKKKGDIKKKTSYVGSSSNVQGNSVPHSKVVHCENQPQPLAEETTEDVAVHTDHEVDEDVAVDTDYETAEDKSEEIAQQTRQEPQQNDSYTCGSPAFVMCDLDKDFDPDELVFNPMDIYDWGF